MTGPDDEDPGFPEVTPASTELPVDDDVKAALEELESRTGSEGPFDTGSDAWWRAQATAQREAASQDAPARPPIDASPPLVQPQLPTPEPPTPLDDQWLPEDLPGAPSGPPVQASTPSEPVPPVPPAPAPLPPAPPPTPPAP
ncbi:MAG TPA: hypothetical protein VL281_04465, partial [Mycobacteriales bacterium]|nr:hypothetical protein [Mycobacteriales bacterium]